MYPGRLSVRGPQEVPAVGGSEGDLAQNIEVICDAHELAR